MKYLLLTIIFLNFSTLLFSQSKADDIAGTWYSEAKQGNVYIYKCGKYYFGRLVYLKHANDNDGNPVLDINNPDEFKRKSPLVGIVFLTNFIYNKDKKKWKGRLYDYDGAKGNSYDSYISITKNGSLNIKGFWGLSFFGLNSGLTLTKLLIE